MDKTEMEALVEQLKASGLNEEEILDTFFATFQEGKMDRKDLEACANFMGYELTDEFKNEQNPDPIAEKDDDNSAGVSKELAEDAKEIKPGQSEEEFKKELNLDNKSDDNEKEIDEEKEWEEVQKKFKW